MPRNIEIKARVADRTALEQRADSTGVDPLPGDD